MQEGAEARTQICSEQPSIWFGSQNSPGVLKPRRAEGGQLGAIINDLSLCHLQGWFHPALTQGCHGWHSNLFPSSTRISPPRLNDECCVCAHTQEQVSPRESK